MYNQFTRVPNKSWSVNVECYEYYALVLYFILICELKDIISYHYTQPARENSLFHDYARARSLSYGTVSEVSKVLQRSLNLYIFCCFLYLTT